jgi:hypothetical protein
MHSNDAVAAGVVAASALPILGFRARWVASTFAPEGFATAMFGTSAKTVRGECRPNRQLCEPFLADDTLMSISTYSIAGGYVFCCTD